MPRFLETFHNRNRCLMTSLPLEIVLQLALAQAPQLVAPETIATFAYAESRFNPYAIYDNTARRSHAPKTAAEATTLATRLLAQGHSIDTGLMQINSANFRRVGLDAVSAFNPTRSISAGAEILADAYRTCSDGKSAQPLRCMASIYNTGRRTAGERNGYVSRIFAAADTLVPAIRKALPEKTTLDAPATPVTPHACGPPPPAWDGWASADHKRCIRNSQVKPTQSEATINEVK
jgi:type IV secretion system protein VirB1